MVPARALETEPPIVWPAKGAGSVPSGWEFGKMKMPAPLASVLVIVPVLVTEPLTAPVLMIWIAPVELALSAPVLATSPVRVASLTVMSALKLPAPIPALIVPLLVMPPTTRPWAAEPVTKIPPLRVP